MVDRLNGVLSSVLSEQHISFSSGGHTHSFTLSPARQLLAGTCAVALVGWLAIGTASVVLTGVTEAEHSAQKALLTESWETRLNAALTDRNDLLEARHVAETRLEMAQDQLAGLQADLLEEVAQGDELRVSLGLLRDELTASLAERDAAVQQNADLVEELSRVTGDLTERFGEREDMEGTITALVTALERTATSRDRALGQRSELQADLAALELKVQVNAERQERLVAQLEEAVQVSFVPLQEMFKASGMNVDSIVSTIRRNYSGTGGPLIESSASTRSFDDPELTARFASLMEGMDRVNVMRMAAERLPYSMPVLSSYRFTSGFGTRRDPKTGGYRAHNGIDLAGSTGTPIHATADGVVVFASRQRGFGNLIKIRHEFGFETLYAHLNRIRVKVGDRVSRGNRIGDMGSTGRSTGTHLHYEVRIGGKPVNPMTYIKAARNVF